MNARCAFASDDFPIVLVSSSHCTVSARTANNVVISHHGALLWNQISGTRLNIAELFSSFLAACLAPTVYTAAVPSSVRCRTVRAKTWSSAGETPIRLYGVATEQWYQHSQYWPLFLSRSSAQRWPGCPPTPRACPAVYMLTITGAFCNCYAILRAVLYTRLWLY